MMQTGSRYGMITMEDAIGDLLEAGIIDKEEAHRALLKTSDESEDGEERDSSYASGAVGGGKMESSGGASGGQSNEGGYSF